MKKKKNSKTRKTKQAMEETGGVEMLQAGRGSLFHTLSWPRALGALSAAAFVMLQQSCRSFIFQRG